MAGETGGGVKVGVVVAGERDRWGSKIKENNKPVVVVRKMYGGRWQCGRRRTCV